MFQGTKLPLTVWFLAIYLISQAKTGLSALALKRHLGVSYPTLKEWKRRYHGDATPVRADLEAENRALQAELARVREQRDILKKTLGILSEPSKHATNASKA